MKTNSEVSHFYQSNLPIAESVGFIRKKTFSSTVKPFYISAFAHSISKASLRDSSDIRAVHNKSPS